VCDISHHISLLEGEHRIFSKKNFISLSLLFCAYSALPSCKPLSEGNRLLREPSKKGIPALSSLLASLKNNDLCAVRYNTLIHQF
jgi:hypothetical protein